MIDEIRYPWWGIVAPGPIDRVRSQVLRVVTRLRLPYGPDQITFVSGDSWTGVFFFRREPPAFEIPDALRESSTDDVIVLTLDKHPAVSRWSHGTWSTVDDPHASRHASEHGIRVPGSLDPSKMRPLRRAALILGVRSEQLRELVRESSHLLDTGRGAVVLDEIYFDDGKIEGATVVYRVHRFLDDGSFSCDVASGEQVAEYWTDGKTITGIESLADVEGETDPRTIVGKLGIPEDWMFPSSDN